MLSSSPGRSVDTPYRPLERKLRDMLVQSFRRSFLPDQRWYSSFRSGMIGQRYGIPDQYFIACGRSAWVESKVHPNRLSPLQAQQISRMRNAGARVVTVVWHPSDRLLFAYIGGEYSPHPQCIWESKALIRSLTRKFWDAVLGLKPLLSPRAHDDVDPFDHES